METKLTRRTAVRYLAIAAGTCLAPKGWAATETTPAIRITDQPLRTIPQNFTGLSYESAQLAHPDFFSLQNRNLVEFFRTLGHEGVLRIGGNTSEYTQWQDHDNPEMASGKVEGPDPGTRLDHTFTITPRSIDNLVGFLDTTNWTLLYGLNLAKGITTQLVEEAKYVAKAAGHRLVALQLGNEPDLFREASNPSQRWTYEQFIARWREVYAAVREALPDVPIAGPDSSDPKWNKRFSEDAGSLVVFESGHYYAEGPPKDPRMTIDYLLHPGDRLQTYVLAPIAATLSRGRNFRMTEGNTCYSAGKQGVSDTFASALWVIDFMLTAASAGASGVNLHGGGNGFYTPIAGSPASQLQARPIYYGMLAFVPFLGTTLQQVEMDAAGRNMTAYAARSGQEMRVILIHREASSTRARVTLPGPSPYRKAELWRLAAPSIDSTDQVTWAGAQVNAAGDFSAMSHTSIKVEHGIADLDLPAYSATLLFVRP